MVYKNKYKELYDFHKILKKQLFRIYLMMAFILFFINQNILENVTVVSSSLTFYNYLL